ncbi:MAG: hypothetical protein JXK07_08735 [Spirochaetes bacterium]|nr:hypothetical protein [Spirochaetota bacterium]MBN2772580.1 hypothetical protein [Spirochaetota bacterium]
MNEINKRLGDSNWDYKIASTVIGRKKSQRNRMVALLMVIVFFSGLLTYITSFKADSEYYINNQIYSVIEKSYSDNSDLYAIIETEQSLDSLIYSELAGR